MEEIEQQQQYQEAEFKVLLDIYETYKDKTDYKYCLSVKSKITKFYFDLVVIDSNNTVVEELFSESLEWKGLNSASKKLQTLPSNRKEARKKFSHINSDKKKKL
ncbi:hypothetical protein ACTFIR_011877 [Dictyostelium discoideum]